MRSTVVELYTLDPRLRRLVSEAVSPAIVHHKSELKPPKSADLVVTKAGLTPALERFAAQLGTFACVLPEGAAWLARRIETADRLVIVGADMVKIRV